MTNERRAELMRAMQGEPDDQAVLFINGWGPSEITCGELRALLTATIGTPAPPSLTAPITFDCGCTFAGNAPPIECPSHPGTREGC